MRPSPRVPGHGPTPARIAIVGEVPGVDEDIAGLPFVGRSGEVLNGMLEQVGINRSECFLTNLFSERPPEGVVARFCIEADDRPVGYDLPPLARSPGNLFLAPDRLWELDRLNEELNRASPNVIIAMGNVATWALLRVPEITKMRGTVYRACPPFLPRKVLPTFHPAAVARQWGMRPIVCVDLAKALTESLSSTVRYDNAELWLAPTLDDLYAFDKYMERSTQISVDVETRIGMITEIGFGPSPDRAINIPFRLINEKGRVCGNYWETAHLEKQARLWCRRWLNSPTSKVMQNGMYDTQYLVRELMSPRNFDEDTMLAQHALFSEMPKDLGFLGSVHTNHPSWKYLARRHQDDFKKEA